MTYAHGFLAAGGLHSELEVKNVRGGGGTCFKGNVGGERGAVNNALHVGKHSNGGWVVWGWFGVGFGLVLVWFWFGFGVGLGLVWGLFGVGAAVARDCTDAKSWR